MSDTYRRYGAIKRSLMQLLPGPMSGHREGHFNTLAALICGLVAGQHAHLSVNHRPQMQRDHRQCYRLESSAIVQNLCGSPQ